MTARALAACTLVACALTGCITPAATFVGPFVRSVAVSGNYLVVESCMVSKSGEELALARCSVERQLLPVTAQLPASLAPQQILDALTPPVRARVAECTTRFGITGHFTVRFEIASGGRIIDALPGTGTLAFHECVGNAVGGERLPPTLAPSTVTVTF
jgi:hypothetical protein